MFTLGYVIEGTRFGVLLNDTLYREQLSLAVVVDVAGFLRMLVQQIEVGALREGSLVVAADVYANANEVVAGGDAEAQRAAADQQYLAASHDFATVRAVYRAANGATGESLRTLTINMTNRDDLSPTAASASDFGVESCGFACGAFIAVIGIFLVLLTCGCCVIVDRIRRRRASEEKAKLAASTTVPAAIVTTDTAKR